MDERLIALDACVSDLRDEMVGFTSDLMAVASENPPGTRIPGMRAHHQVATARAWSARETC